MNMEELAKMSNKELQEELRRAEEEIDRSDSDLINESERTKKAYSTRAAIMRRISARQATIQ